MHIGERIRKFREDRRWTQETLALRSGVPQGTISRAERGLVKPLFESVAQIAQAFGFGIDTLAGIPRPEGEILDSVDPDVLWELKSDKALAEALKNREIINLVKALSPEFGHPSSSKGKDLQAVLRTALKLLEDEETKKDRN